ncbi:MAG: hypothetical protein R3197_17465 [Paracoccaceae bacterium]|nr:hypothetical protein [Paracoccaceae bacterium]
MKIYRAILGLALMPALAFMTLMATPAVAWLEGKDHPSQAQIELWIEEELGSRYVITSVNVRSQDLRRGMFEYSETRLEIQLDHQEDLFQFYSHLEDGVPVIARTYHASSGKDLRVFAIIRAVPTGESWEKEMDFDETSQDILNWNGHPRNSFSPQAVVLDEPDYVAHLAKLESERLERAEQVSGVFSGHMKCGANLFEFQRFEIDAVSGKGQIIWREAKYGANWMTEGVAAEENARTKHFDVKMEASTNRFEIRMTENGPQLVTNHCETTMYPYDSVPLNIVNQRDKVKRFLASLSQEPAKVALSEKDSPRAARAKILDVTDEGFRLSLMHPLFLNGVFNKSDENTQASIIEIRFVDSEKLAVIRSPVEGRGDPLFGSSCILKLSITDSNELILENTERFGCNERLVLTP